jgi:hypothetical protein
MKEFVIRVAEMTRCGMAYICVARDKEHAIEKLRAQPHFANATIVSINGEPA